MLQLDNIFGWGCCTVNFPKSKSLGAANFNLHIATRTDCGKTTDYGKYYTELVMNRANFFLNFFTHDV